MSTPDEKRVRISDARQNLTELVAEVRLLGDPVVLTRREKDQVVVVSKEWFERAKAALAEQT